MEIINSIINRFWKREKPLKPISAVLGGRFTSHAWAYDHFREYLISLGRNKDFLLPINQYPELIELSQQWHVSLEDLRSRTRARRREHYSVIGLDTLLRALKLPARPCVGEKSYVPSETIMRAKTQAHKNGVRPVIGDIHTHPRMLPQDDLVFSMADLYRIVEPRSTYLVNAVVGGDETLFIFRTRNSILLDSDPSLNQDNFCRLWYEENGYRYIDRDPKGGEKAIPLTSNAPTLWQLNLKVARKYNLVLYIGEQSSDLVKVYPIGRHTANILV